MEGAIVPKKVGPPMERLGKAEATRLFVDRNKESVCDRSLKVWREEGFFKVQIGHSRVKCPLEKGASSLCEKVYSSLSPHPPRSILSWIDEGRFPPLKRKEGGGEAFVSYITKRKQNGGLECEESDVKKLCLWDVPREVVCEFWKGGRADKETHSLGHGEVTLTFEEEEDALLAAAAYEAFNPVSPKDVVYGLAKMSEENPFILKGARASGGGAAPASVLEPAFPFLLSTCQCEDVVQFLKREQESPTSRRVLSSVLVTGKGEVLFLCDAEVEPWLWTCSDLGHEVFEWRKKKGVCLRVVFPTSLSQGYVLIHVRSSYDVVDFGWVKSCRIAECPFLFNTSGILRLEDWGGSSSPFFLEHPHTLNGKGKRDLDTSGWSKKDVDFAFSLKRSMLSLGGMSPTLSLIDGGVPIHPQVRFPNLIVCGREYAVRVSSTFDDRCFSLVNDCLEGYAPGVAGRFSTGSAFPLVLEATNADGCGTACACVLSRYSMTLPPNNRRGSSFYVDAFCVSREASGSGLGGKVWREAVLPLCSFLSTGEEFSVFAQCITKGRGKHFWENKLDPSTEARSLLYQLLCIDTCNIHIYPDTCVSKGRRFRKDEFVQSP